MGHRTEPVPNALTIYERYRHLIIAGEIPVGQRLPTEVQICEMFDASRYMVREALKRLEDEGLITRRQGSGTVVASQRERRKFESSIASLDDLIQYAESTELRVLAVERILLDPQVAKLVELPPRSVWIRVSALRFEDESTSPVAYSEIYVNERFEEIVSLIGRERKALYALIEDRFEAKIEKVRQRLYSVAADANIASRLLVGKGEPVFQIVRAYVSEERETLEFSVNSHPSDRFSYEIVLRRS